MNKRARNSDLVAALAVFYAGMVIGVSFIAVPAKFLAPSIDLAQALDVGRQQFRIFGWFEAAMALVLAGVGFRAGRGIRRGLVIVVLAIVVLQHLGLRPPLDERVRLIMRGEEVPPSPLHTIYGVLEIAKLALLLTVGYLFWRARRSGRGAVFS